MRTYTTVSEAKARLAEFLRKAADEEEEVVVTVNGKPKAVLVAFDKFEGIMETIDLMSDPEEYLELLKRKTKTSRKPAKSLQQILREIERKSPAHV